jgi:hypothetical protein
VDYISLQALKLLGLIRACFLMLYFTPVRCRLEYASVACNTLTSTDACKLERTQVFSPVSQLFLSSYPL